MPRRKIDRWLTLPQCAALLGVHRQTVANMVARGELVSDTVAGHLVIERNSALAKRRALLKLAEQPQGAA